jgi:hypothetical protein
VTIAVCFLIASVAVLLAGSLRAGIAVAAAAEASRSRRGQRQPVPDSGILDDPLDAVFDSAADGYHATDHDWDDD